MDKFSAMAVLSSVRGSPQNAVHYTGEQWKAVCTLAIKALNEASYCTDFLDVDLFTGEETTAGTIMQSCAETETKTAPNCKNNQQEKDLQDRVAMHREIVTGLTELYERKNRDYGDSFHKIFIEEGLASSRIRLSDKLERFKQLSRGAEQQVNDESMSDTIRDLANYAILTLIELRRQA